MIKNIKNLFFVELNLKCLNKDNKKINIKIDLGMIMTKDGINPKDYLIKYCESKLFHDLIWNHVNAYYEPSSVKILFLKPKIISSSIIIPSKKIMHTTHYKL